MVDPAGPPPQAVDRESSLPAQYLDQWQRGDKPDLAEFLSKHVQATVDERCAVLRVDLRERWRQSDRARVEEYFDRFLFLATEPEASLDLIFTEFLIREDLGQTPTLEEYVTRFPNFRETLTTQIELHRAVMEAERASLDGSTGHADSAILSSTGGTSIGADQDFSASTLATAGDQLPAARIGRYTLLRLLGHGGMGRVYLARDELLDRLVGLKLPRIGKTRGGELIDRMYREARAAARLTHPNLCVIHDIGDYQGSPYLALQYIAGPTLAERLRAQGKLPAEEALSIAAKIAAALAVVHRAGIVHRDLKPANIMFDDRDEPIVMDFGLAFLESAVLGAETEPILPIGLTTGEQVDHDTQRSRMTETGHLLGTPAYAAPEQFVGNVQAITTACDIYGLGAVLYEMLTGRPPFIGNLEKVTLEVLSTPPALPSTIVPEISASVDQLCQRSLAKNPVDRFESIHAFQIAIIEAASELNRRPRFESEVSTDADAGDGGSNAKSRKLFTRRRAVVTGLACGAGAIGAGYALRSRKAPATELVRIELNADAPELKMVRHQPWHDRHAFFTGFSPDGKYYWAAGEYFGGQPVSIWETHSGELKLRVEGAFARFSLDGKTMFVPSARDGAAIQRWDMTSGRRLPNLDLNEGRPIDLCITNDGHFMITTHPNQVVGRSVETGARLQSVAVENPNSLYVTTSGSKGRTLVCDRRGVDPAIVVIDWNQHQVADTILVAEASNDRDVVAARGGDRFVVFDPETSIKVCELNPFRLIRKLAMGDASSKISMKAVAPDLRWCLIGLSSSPNVYLVNLETGQTHGVFKKALQRLLGDQCFSPNQQYAALCAPWPSDVYLLEMPAEVRLPTTGGV